MAGMGGWFKDLDELLRGRKTQPEKLLAGTDHLRAGPFIFICVLLGMGYGLFMGLYSVVNHEPPLYWQLLSCALKVPALFLLTLFVTFPSFYVFSALRGARMGPAATLRVVVAAITVNMTILASLGPVAGFFALTTDSYPFMKLLHIAIFTVCGIIGLKFLSSMLSKLEQAGQPPAAPPPVPAAAPSTDTMPPPIPYALPADISRRNAAAGRSELYSHSVFRVWVIMYALVGAQMAWVLRPFIVAPGRAFEVFRERQSNFFVDVLKTIGALFGP